MWIVFRDPKTIFNHLDKVVLEVVDDADIGAYQRQLHATLGGHAHFIHAKGLTKTQDAAVDDTEELSVEFHSRAEVRALMERGEIVILDCLAMIGVMGL